MFLRKILGRFLTTAPEKQELNRQHLLQVSTELGLQLELIPAIPSMQQYPQQIILSPCDELHFHPPNQLQQLNQSQEPYPQHFNISLNSSAVSPNQPILNPFLASALIQTPPSPLLPTPSFQMRTSQDNTANLINSYLVLLSQSQAPSTPPQTTPNPSSQIQHIYPNFQHAFQSWSSTLRESHHTPLTSSHSSSQALPSSLPPFILTELSSNLQNEIKLLKEENRRFSDKMVLMRGKRGSNPMKLKY